MYKGLFSGEFDPHLGDFPNMSGDTDLSRRRSIHGGNDVVVTDRSTVTRANGRGDVGDESLREGS